MQLQNTRYAIDRSDGGSYCPRSTMVQENSLHRGFGLLYRKYGYTNESIFISILKELLYRSYGRVPMT